MDIKVGQLFRHQDRSSSHYGAICKVVKVVNQSSIQLKIVQPGENNYPFWIGSLKPIGTFFDRQFGEANTTCKFGLIRSLEEGYNPVLEKIKMLDEKFAKKQFKSKEYVSPLPLP